MKNIEVEGIKVQIEKKQIKNFNLTVRAPYGEVKLTYPSHLKQQDCYRFIKKKIAWIQKQQVKLKAMKLPKPLDYRDGERIYLLGEANKLNLQLASKRSVTKSVNQIYLNILKNDTRKEKEQLINEFYRKELYQVIKPIVKKWEPIMQVEVYEARIKNMKTLWGSCNIKAQRIWLNLQLAKYDKQCIEYVIVHEMVHLHERLHNKRFYRLMDKYLPDWKEREHVLNRMNK